MTKKYGWLPALGVAALLIGLVAIPALAATGGAPTLPGATPGTPGNAPGYGFGPGGRGMMGFGTGGRGLMGLGIGPLNDEIAAILKLSPADLQAARQSGQSLADIAAKQGVSREDLIAAVLKVHQDAVAAHVTDGTLTQAQADQILSFMKSQIERQIDANGVGRAAGRGGFGCGPRGGNAPAGTGFGRGRGLMGSVTNS
ncbi:MAG: hypothetical protein ACYC5Y_06300 [Symbiobacteriia bacterium]